MKNELVKQTIIYDIAKRTYITEDHMASDQAARMTSVSRLEYNGPDSKIHKEHLKEIRRMNIETLTSGRIRQSREKSEFTLGTFSSE